MIDLGPQYAGDDELAARMRFHQSWYRANVLKVACGAGPASDSPRTYGNMLRPEDGAQGMNFLSAEIFRKVQERIALKTGTVDDYRWLHNMLSSQPMCANLVGPMMSDPERATRIGRAIWGDRVSRVTRVELEWAPEPACRFLGDRTAFDAFIEYELPNSALGFVGIETKLTEPFSQKRYDGPSYRRWMTDGGPWRAGARDAVAHVRHNQLWRDHLLVWSMLCASGSPYAEGRLAVVYHPRDEVCADTVAAYSDLLDDRATLQDLSLSKFLEPLRQIDDLTPWRDDFEVRYLALDRSEAAWKQHEERRGR